MQNSSHDSGVFAGVGAYLIWGAFPAFFGLLAFAAPVEILANRIVWTLVFLLAVLAVLGQLRGLREIAGRTWLYAAAGSVLLAVNWTVYIYGVTSGHVVECALGYFINPLVSVLFGVAFFCERLTRAQVVAVTLALVAVVVLTVEYGQPPVIALTLAFSFAGYGVVKKLVPLEPLRSLAAETLVGAPLAVAYLVFLIVTGASAVTDGNIGHTLLLLSAGPVTFVPLLLFGIAAQRVPLTVMGILQYLTPSLQMAWGVVVGHEVMPANRWIGFALIWCALVVFSAGRAKRRGKLAPGAMRRHRHSRHSAARLREGVGGSA